MDKFRVLLCMGSKTKGGAQQAFFEIAKAFKKYGIEVLALVSKRSGYISELEQYEIPYKTLKFGGMFDFSTKSNIKKIVKSFKPTHIFTFLNRAGSYIPDVKVPVISKIGGYYEEKYYKNTTHFLVNATNVNQHVMQFKKQRPIYQIPGFYMAVPYSPPYHNNTERVVFVGRLHRNKAVDVLIKAFHKSKHVKELHIYGDGPELEALKKLVDDLGLLHSVEFHGWVENSKEYIKQYDIAVIPSREEPFGNILLEVWQACTPVIVSNVGGLGEKITDQHDGFVFENENIDELAKKMDLLLQDQELREKLSTNGHDTFTNNYTEEVVIPKYIQLLEETLIS